MPRAVVKAFSSRLVSVSSNLFQTLFLNFVHWCLPGMYIPLLLLGLLKSPPNQLSQPPQNTLTPRLLISQQSHQIPNQLL